jgi:hypothetical protein
MGIEGGRLVKRGTAAEPGMAIGSRHGCGLEGIIKQFYRMDASFVLS